MEYEYTDRPFVKTETHFRFFIEPYKWMRVCTVQQLSRSLYLSSYVSIMAKAFPAREIKIVMRVLTFLTL